MELYSRLLKLVAPFWKRMALAMCCMLVVAGCTAAGAYLFGPVLDDIFIQKKMEMLKILSLAVLFIFMLKAVCLCANAFLMSYVSQRIITGLRERLYNHIQNLPVPYFDKTPTGRLMSRILNDVGTVNGALSDSVSGMIRESFSIIGLLGLVFYRDWQLALIAILVLPIAFAPLFKFGRTLRKITTQSQQTFANVSVVLHETISGNRIVKAFGMEEHEKKRFRAENQNLLKYAMRAVLARVINSSIMEFFGGLLVVFFISYGGYQVIMERKSPGELVSFIVGLIMLYEPVKRIAGIYGSIQQGLAAATRVYEVLDLPVEKIDEPGAVVLQPIHQEIEFRQVSFRYGDKPVLSDINLKIEAGRIVALVGMSGAGKTTLVNLIPRFYEVTEGAILIDGTDIRDATISSLRGQIAIVTQQTILFNDTVRNNIAYGDVRKSDQELVEAAKAANAYDFIMKMPKGFDTVIGEQGIRVSGGERQRLCIARALLKNAPILILDEATSSLDSDSELEVQKALENLMAGRTTLVIAHRLSTIKNADRIVTISNGRIVEEGHHDELMKSSGEYRRLYELQFAHLDFQDDPGIAARHS
jgi:ATP-binding cassette, subfamily B, bacterial MsbA